jgi:hypothetical protein
LGFGVWGLGFGVWGLGFGVWGFGEISPEVMNYRREYSSAEKVLKNGTLNLFVKSI